MDNCIFCKIIKGELPSAKVYEDEDYIAILDLFPVAEGHTLLIPKKHHVNIFDIPDDMAVLAYPRLKALAGAIRKATGCDGLNIVQNNEASAGQVVFHSHIHLIPRFEGDDIRVAIAGKKKAEYDDLSRMAESITSNLK